MLTLARYKNEKTRILHEGKELWVTVVDIYKLNGHDLVRLKFEEKNNGKEFMITREELINPKVKDKK